VLRRLQRLNPGEASDDARRTAGVPAVGRRHQLRDPAVGFGVFVFAHEWLYRMHTRWFALSRESFDA
jgi:hypothetical protein